jgi:hypothetical protein
MIRAGNYYYAAIECMPGTQSAMKRREKGSRIGFTVLKHRLVPDSPVAGFDGF